MVRIGKEDRVKFLNSDQISYIQSYNNNLIREKHSKILQKIITLKEAYKEENKQKFWNADKRFEINQLKKGKIL